MKQHNIVYTAQNIFEMSNNVVDDLIKDIYSSGIDKPKILYVCMSPRGNMWFHDIVKALPSGFIGYAKCDDSTWYAKCSSDPWVIDLGDCDRTNIDLIYIFDIICTSGNQFEGLKRILTQRYPYAVTRTCSLIQKPIQAKYNPDFVGIATDRKSMLFGYGLDDHRANRNAPYIYERRRGKLK